DFDAPPMADSVRAIHLVAADGTQRWIEPANGAITDRGRLTTAQRHIARDHIHYDDDMFSAALVSLGTLGVIVSVILEVRAQYSLNEVVHPVTWAVIRRQLLDGSLFGDGPGDPPWLAAHEAPTRGPRVPKAVSVFINPYRSSGNYTSGDGHAERKAMLVTYAESSDGFRVSEPRPDLGIFDKLHLIKDFEAASNLKDTASAVQRVIDLLRPQQSAGG